MNPGIWFPVEYVLIVDQDWFGENGKLGGGELYVGCTNYDGGCRYQERMGVVSRSVLTPD